MGALVAYLEHVGTGSPTFLQPPVRHQAGDRMAIDAATRESLELVRTMTGARDGSLLGTIDRTVTRSEEHTSELQSLMRISYAVFCLKKKIYKQTNDTNE